MHIEVNGFTPALRSKCPTGIDMSPHLMFDRDTYSLLVHEETPPPVRPRSLRII